MGCPCGGGSGIPPLLAARDDLSERGELISSSSLRLDRLLRAGVRLFGITAFFPFPRLVRPPSYSKSESLSGSEPGSAMAYSSSFM